MSGHHAILVLGMHRSGTSSLAGALEAAGLDLGAVRRKSKFNAKGNRESGPVNQLNDAVLAASGGSWDAPPARVAWTAEQRAQRDAIVAGFAGSARWGFKDPRTLLTLSGWLEALPAARSIGTFRHPAAVAASLARRNGMDAARAGALWLRYNEALLAHWRSAPFDLVCFDWPAERYAAALAKVAARAGLAGAPRFFEPGLRTADAADTAALPAGCLALHEQLRTIADTL